MNEVYAVLVMTILLTTFAVIRFTNKSKEEKQILKENAFQTIKASLYSLIVEAEQALGAGTGEAKKSLVIDLVKDSPFYINLPNYIKLFVNAEIIGELIDDIVEDKLKPALKNGMKL